MREEGQSIGLTDLADRQAVEGHCPLSAREQDVLRLLCAGCSTEEIARALFLSSATVSSHRKNMITKTGSRNTCQVIYKACRAGWI